MRRTIRQWLDDTSTPAIYIESLKTLLSLGFTEDFKVLTSLLSNVKKVTEDTSFKSDNPELLNKYHKDLMWLCDNVERLIQVNKKTNISFRVCRGTPSALYMYRKDNETGYRDDGFIINPNTGIGYCFGYTTSSK